MLGHALYLKAIHGGKTKTDVIDAQKLARLLRGGTFTEAYVYPKAMRATCDVLRRRTYFVRKRAELAHLQMTFLQYNLTPPAQKLCYAANRAALDLDVFADPSTRTMLRADLTVVNAPGGADQEPRSRTGAHSQGPRSADVPSFAHGSRHRSGAALILLYEVHDIRRFEDEGRFLSYARLVGGMRESAGKKLGTGGRKIGNAHLKWAFSEATCLLIRSLPKAKTWLARKNARSARSGARRRWPPGWRRTVYHLWRKTGGVRCDQIPGELVAAPRPGSRSAELGRQRASASGCGLVRTPILISPCADDPRPPHDWIGPRPGRR